MDSFDTYDVINLTRARGTELIRLSPVSASVRFSKFFSVRRPNPSLRRTEVVCPRLINFSHPASASVQGWPFSSHDPALDINVFDRQT